jgi:protein gp37
MADQTNIEWADSTANLWIGCTKLSPGCDNCYAEADFDHRKHRVTWGPHGDRSFCAAGWDTILRMQRFATKHGGTDPLLGRKRRIFINSLSDFFDNHRSITWRDEAFKLFEACPDVILMLVTKRPENVVRMVPEHWLMPGGWPRHVWLIVSTEDQERYDHRWPILRDLAGPAVKGLSCEPLLGRIQLRDVLFLQWCIVGGESGPKARDNDFEANARHLRDQCELGHVAFFGKQNVKKAALPADLKVREMPL